MKKIFSIFVIAIMMLAVSGCGCENKKEKEQPSSTDNPSSVPQKVELKEDSREEKDFESLDDRLTLFMVQGNIKYTMIVYFKDGKANNGVVQMECPSEQIAIDMYSSHRNDDMYEDVVIDGNMVSYDFSEKGFVYKNMTKDEATESLVGQGYKVIN